MKQRSMSGLTRTLMLASVVAAFAVSSSWAQGGWFVGATIGETEFQDYELEEFSTSLDDSDTGFMVFGGYRLSPYFLVGAGWADLGELNAEGELPVLSLTRGPSISASPDGMPLAIDRPLPGGDGGTTQGGPTFSDTLEASGVAAFGQGILPLGERFALFGTLGAFAWQQDVTYVDGFDDFDGDSSGVDLMWGGGINWDILQERGLHVHLAWHSFSDVGDLDETGHENDIEFLSAGVTFAFGP